MADINWIENYEQGLSLAKKENKLIVLMLSKQNCKACEAMEYGALDDDDIVEDANENFVFIHVDVYHDTFPKKRFSYIGTPTFYFLNKDIKRLDRIMGVASSKEFFQTMQKVKKQK
jgi:thioredoxin-related protein